ncbi:hypothetical protein SAMD00019534_014210, partial [Acytostelium subglobosum LB1]|uniref:hypothetical protein n=1 Tax=Acytostelium subglobosum LB1 TaxID=1410327 RepID=UPI000644A6A6
MMNRFINSAAAINRHTRIAQSLVGLSTPTLRSNIVTGPLSSVSLLTSASAPSCASNQTRSIWVIGKDAIPKDYVDPNAPTTYKLKTIYTFNRVAKGRPGAKATRYHGFVPCTITGGGLPLRNVAVEWGRIFGLTKTGHFYTNRKYVLNIEDKEKIVVKLSNVEMHAVTERAMFIKFTRTEDNPETVKELTLPHLVVEKKRDEERQAKLLKKQQYRELMNIDLTFKPAVRKSDMTA